VLADKVFQIVSASKFLGKVKTERFNIKSTRFIPPKLGEKSFGNFYIEYYYAPAKQSATSATEE
jgi:hypothetical protein